MGESGECIEEDLKLRNVSPSTRKIYLLYARKFVAHIPRARITQIMNLLLLAPDIQEAILFLPPTDGRRAPVRERTLRPIAAVPDWRKQRRMWGGLVGSRARSCRVGV